MSKTARPTRVDIDALVDEHRRLVELVNDLTLATYLLGDHATLLDDRALEYQRAARAVIRRVQSLLFRYDQQILPRIEPEDHCL